MGDILPIQMVCVANETKLKWKSEPGWKDIEMMRMRISISLSLVLCIQITAKNPNKREEKKNKNKLIRGIMDR